MKSNDLVFTDAAMSVIRKADPGLATRIDAAPEPLTVVTDPVDVAIDVVADVGMENAYALMMNIANAYGVTVRLDGNPLDRHIWLNKAGDRKAGEGTAHPGGRTRGGSPGTRVPAPRRRERTCSLPGRAGFRQGSGRRAAG